DKATVKRCSPRNLATRCWTSFPLGALRSGRTISFDPRVSGSARIRNHLSAGEQFTPRTYHAEANDNAEKDSTKNHLLILVMKHFKVPAAYPGKRNPCDIYCDQRDAGKGGPQQIYGRPTVVCPLCHSDPAHEYVRDIDERGACRRYHHVP